jgi:hypothetical protein
MHKYLSLLILVVITAACNSNKKEEDKVIAKVDGKYLMMSEIKELVPPETLKEDSLLIASNYIHQWIKKQLLISKAELNLTDQNKDVSKMVEDYRSSLIIHKYKQQLLNQKLDTVVSPFEIENYYRKFPDNFILSRNIIKALFVKIPKPVAELKRVRKLYQSDEDKDWEALEDYCFQNATKFDNFNDQWIYARELLSMLPNNIENEDDFLQKNKNIEMTDSTHRYFVKINKHMLRNNLAPLEFVRDDIEKIIINKRKISFIKNLEENIYRDAEAKNKFKIY